MITRTINMSPEESRIHAHICLDGNMSKGISRRCKSELLERPNRKFRTRYNITYWNYSEELRKEFQNDIKKVYNRECVVDNKYKRVKTDGKWIFERLLFLGAGKSREWNIPKLILNGSMRVKKEWIRVAIDDEGTITKYGAVRIRSVNKKGMIQLQKMILSLGINSNITPKRGVYKDSSIYLAINKTEVPKLIMHIGLPKHEEKKRKLKIIFRI